MSELKDLIIEEVSLVDEGANPGAEIVLVKRKGGKKPENGNEMVTAYLEKLRKKLEEHLQKAERNELLKVASKYEILGEKSEELAKVLEIAKGTELYDKIIENLDRELSLAEKSDLYKELGKRGRGTSNTIEELTKKFMAENSQLTERQARARAFEAQRGMEGEK